MELPDHMQEVVGRNPHPESKLVGLEPLTIGLVPPQGVLALLDPVFYLGRSVIDLDHLAGWQSGVGDHKTDPGKSSPGCHSILTTTRRGRLQLLAG